MKIDNVYIHIYILFMQMHKYVCIYTLYLYSDIHVYMHTYIHMWMYICMYEICTYAFYKHTII